MLKIYGEHDDATIAQMKVTLEEGDAVKGVLCADGHLGYSFPIGGVVAYKNSITPGGVGYDIACGNFAVMLDVNPGKILPHLGELLDTIKSEIAFGVGRKNDEPVESKLFDEPFWGAELFRDLKQLAMDQLGTVGSGNHFVDLFTDENGKLWVGVHFGSRGLGHKLATHFIKASGGTDGMNVKPVVIPVNSPLGQDYWFAMTVAGVYAYEGREWVVNKVAEILSANIVDGVHNHHNYAWKEEHGGEEYYVVRKGSTPAFPGQRSFIGGSMGDDSYIVEGLDTEESRDSLYSTVHGAGRVMSRTKAAGKTKFKKGKRIKVSDGLISREMMENWLHYKGVLLRGGGMDESPHCYRRLDEVLEEHKDTIKKIHRLRPIGVVMAGEDEYDPYKD